MVAKQKNYKQFSTSIAKPKQLEPIIKEKGGFTLGKNGLY
jgi:hypothetical protein